MPPTKKLDVDKGKPVETESIPEATPAPAAEPTLPLAPEPVAEPIAAPVEPPKVEPPTEQLEEIVKAAPVKAKVPEPIELPPPPKPPAKTFGKSVCPKCGSTACTYAGGQQHCNACGHSWD